MHALKAQAATHALAHKAQVEALKAATDAVAMAEKKLEDAPAGIVQQVASLQLQLAGAQADARDWRAHATALVPVLARSVGPVVAAAPSPSAESHCPGLMSQLRKLAGVLPLFRDSAQSR